MPLQAEAVEQRLLNYLLLAIIAESPRRRRRPCPHGLRWAGASAKRKYTPTQQERFCSYLILPADIDNR